VLESTSDDGCSLFAAAALVRVHIEVLRKFVQWIESTMDSRRFDLITCEELIAHDRLRTLKC
jgi:Ni,Fe-hydrogenase III component G